MPMHCSANEGPAGDVALFFGLSGTGKTTLSADPNRTLIGDDETGWGPDGIFNFEGGCYAKCVNLSHENEPEIWDATNRFGAILENVVFDPDTRVPDYTNISKTENTRSAYPLDFIPNASRTGRAPQPKNVVMLAADAFGHGPQVGERAGRGSRAVRRGTEPRRNATTGVPHAIASIITRPNGSGQSMGKSRPRASPRSLPFSFSSTSPAISVALVRLRSTTMRWLVRSTSSSSDEMKMQDVPSSARSSTSFWMSALVPTSIPRVGSSRISSCGFVASQRARMAFC